LEHLELLLEDDSLARKMRRLERYSTVNRRFSVLEHPLCKEYGDGGFYGPKNWPSTADRMKVYQESAFPLAHKAIEPLFRTLDRRAITHLIITSCTGFYAPGLDLEIIRWLELEPTVQRSIIGFMGCYAAINAMQSAYHIVRSNQEARVLMVNLELCSLHLQKPQTLEEAVPFLLFADGCAASVIGAKPEGLLIRNFYSSYIPEGWDDMSWNIGNSGFNMHLSQSVPRLLAKNLNKAFQTMGLIADLPELAIHPGGESILRALEKALDLPCSSNQLETSRNVLREVGNVSSATIMFVLQKLQDYESPDSSGLAMAFGPGLSMECMQYERV
jgi:predicted naringenin-chalcone synthase